MPCTSTTCTARQPLVLHVEALPGTTRTRPAPQELSLSVSERACASGVSLARQGLAEHFHDLHDTSANMRGTSATSNARWGLACYTRDPPSTPGLLLHVRERTFTSGACRTRQELPFQDSHLHCTLTTCIARQRLARHVSHLHCTSGPCPATQGPAQQPRDLRCTSGNALARYSLALPAKDLPSKTATCTAL